MDGQAEIFIAPTGCERQHVKRLLMPAALVLRSAAVSGHSSLAQVQVYIDEVDQKRMAEVSNGKVGQKENSR